MNADLISVHPRSSVANSFSALSFRLKIAVILEQLIVFFAAVCTTYGLDVVPSPGDI
jgi:hypothetical protein